MFVSHGSLITMSSFMICRLQLPLTLMSGAWAGSCQMNDAGTGERSPCSTCQIAFLREIVAAESICYHARNSDLDPLLPLGNQAIGGI